VAVAEMTLQAMIEANTVLATDECWMSD